MPEPSATPSLSYGTGDPLKVRVVRWISAQSTWRISIVLMMLAVVPYAFGLIHYLPVIVNHQMARRVQDFLPFAALFLPASIRRLSWRQGIVSMLLSVVAFAIDWEKWSNLIGYPFNWICWPAPLVGFAYWLTTRPRKWPDLVLITLACLATSLATPTLAVLVYRPIVFQLRHGGSTYVLLSFVVQFLILAPLTWVAIQYATSSSKAVNINRRWIAAGSTLAVATVWFLIYFHLLVFLIARSSVVHGWPMGRNEALWFLQQRHSAVDDLAIWRALESADWSKPEDAVLFEPDYRESCIQVLSQRNRAWEARQLATLLHNQPSPLLANDAAVVLGGEKRYEAAPELMRYALLNSLDCRHAKDALVSWGVPQAALAVLRSEEEWSFTLTGAGTTVTSNLLQSNSEADLSRLLGKDVGRRWNAWCNLYDAAVDQRPSPLSASQQTEVKRVVTAVATYWRTAGRLQRSRRLNMVIAPNLDAPSTDGFEKEIQKYRDAADALDMPPKSSGR